MNEEGDWVLQIPVSEFEALVDERNAALARLSRAHAALEKIASPNRAIRPTGADALEMARFAREALDDE